MTLFPFEGAWQQVRRKENTWILHVNGEIAILRTRGARA
jgi:hypothetical protein